MAASHFLRSLLQAIVYLLLLIPTAHASSYPVKGAGHGIHPRLEIRTMHGKYPDMWNIYILALQAFHQEKQSSMLSYYQIAGIHGVPNIAWDGVAQQASGVGYCAHDTTLFPTWHRPFLALFEERLQHHALRIAKQFKGHKKKNYLEAAKKLRSPYWDWAIQPSPDLPVFPQLFTTPRLHVISPKHGHQTISNPLYSYKYHPLQSEWYADPWAQWKHTVRYPQSQAADAKSSETQATNAFNAARASTQSLLFQFFTKCSSWLEMSNDNAKHHNPGCSISLESLHNNVHTQIGGYFPLPGNNYYGGHMTVIPYSAHEPAFWLHHTQIDRLFAMWQALYPTHYVADAATIDDTFVIPAGTVVGRKTALQPFHKNKEGDFWDSVEVRDTHVFGYTYPELMHGGQNPRKMRHQINKLYGPQASKHAHDKRSTLTPALTANNGSAFVWNANIATTRFKLGNSYNIYVFFGEPENDDATTWGWDPNAAGSMGVFAAPGMKKSNAVTSSTISLTEKLTEQVQTGVLSSLAELDVIPYLTKNLNVKIVGPNGIQTPSQVPDFNIQVVASTLMPTTDLDEFPSWSPFIEIPHITAGLVGGLGGNGGIL